MDQLEVSKNAIDLNPLTIHRLLAAATVTWLGTGRGKPLSYRIQE